MLDIRLVLQIGSVGLNIILRDAGTEKHQLGENYNTNLGKHCLVHKETMVIYEEAS